MIKHLQGSGNKESPDKVNKRNSGVEKAAEYEKKHQLIFQSKWLAIIFSNLFCSLVFFVFLQESCQMCFCSFPR